MRIVAIASRKGGVGKTTVSVNLAVAAKLAGQTVVIIDIDPQASAAAWNDLRQNEEPPVITTPPTRLQPVLDAARNQGVDACFIDTAPHAESAALAATRSANVAIVPVRPSLMDLVAVGHSIDVCKLAQTPFSILINGVKSKNLLLEAETAIKGLKVDLCPISLGDRVDYVRAFAAGQGVQEFDSAGKAAIEVKRLYRWLEQRLKDI